MTQLHFYVVADLLNETEKIKNVYIIFTNSLTLYISNDVTQSHALFYWTNCFTPVFWTKRFSQRKCFLLVIFKMRADLIFNINKNYKNDPASDPLVLTKERWLFLSFNLPVFVQWQWRRAVWILHHVHLDTFSIVRIDENRSGL